MNTNIIRVVQALDQGYAEHWMKTVIVPDHMMVVLTWVAFILFAAILHRIAWRPITLALEKREHDIRKALEGAEQARQAAQAVAEQCRQQRADAAAQSRELVEQARRAAQDLGAEIQKKAQDDARSLMANARREIDQATAEAADGLRREGAALAVDLAGKLLRREMGPADRAALTDQLLKEM